MTDLQLSLTVVTSVNFGDHGERLPKAHEYVPGETVEDLVTRLFGLDAPYRHLDPTDAIEIRLVVGRDGKPIAPEPKPVSNPWGDTPPL